MFGTSRHVLKYTLSFFKSLVRVSSADLKSEDWQYCAISSAYMNFLETVSGRSAVYILNSVDTNTEPCGKPSLILYVLLTRPFKLIPICLLASILFNKLAMVLQGTIFRNFRTILCLYTIS